MLLDSNNYKSGDGGYKAGQQGQPLDRNFSRNAPSQNDDSYQSINPGQVAPLSDDDGYKSNNPAKPAQLDDGDSYQSINANNKNSQLNDDDGYQSVNPERSSVFEDSGYESANKDNFSNPEFQNQYRQQQRGGLMDQANRAVKRGRAGIQRTIPKKVGESLLGDKQAFMNDSPENRERVKEEAKKRARKAI